MKIYKDSLRALQDAMDRPVVKVQESKRSTVAGFAFDIGHVQHVRKIQNVCVEVSAIDAISHVARQIRQVGVADKFLNLDVLEGHVLKPRMRSARRRVLFSTCV